VEQEPRIGLYVMIVVCIFAIVLFMYDIANDKNKKEE
jgi:hypothetical protein